MLPPLCAPCFDGQGETSPNDAQRVELRYQVANLGPAKRAPALISHMDAVAEEVCMAAGGDVTTDQDGVKKISTISHDYGAPEPVGSIYQGLVRFLKFKGTTQSIGGRLARFEHLRGQAESKMQLAGAYAESSASVLCPQNASPPRSENY